MNKKTKTAFPIIAILLGVFLIVFGGYDDSPGAQLIGFITAVFGIGAIIKKGRKNTDIVKK